MSSQKPNTIEPNGPGYSHAQKVCAIWNRIAEGVSANPELRLDAMERRGPLRAICKEVDRITLFSSLMQSRLNSSGGGEGGDTKSFPASVFFLYLKPPHEGPGSSHLDLGRTKRLNDILNPKRPSHHSSDPASQQLVDTLKQQLATEVSALVVCEDLLAQSLQEHYRSSPDEQFETTVAAVKLKLDPKQYESDLTKTFSQRLLRRLGCDTQGYLDGRGSRESTAQVMDTLLIDIYLDSLPERVVGKKMSDSAVEVDGERIRFQVSTKDSLVKAVTDPLMPDESDISTFCKKLTLANLSEAPGSIEELSEKILSKPDPEGVGNPLNEVCSYYNERWSEAVQEVESLCEYASSMGNDAQRG